MRNWKALCICFVALLCLMLVMMPKVNAATEDIYTYEVANGEATIIKCNTTATGAIMIPNTLGGYPVTAIGSGAFADCTSLTEVTIPDSVTTIEESAFEECRCLKKIAIPDSVTTIEANAFFGCTSLTDITIPDSVTYIGGGAFDGCSSLTSIIIPNGVTTIRHATFFYCENLVSITLPDSVTIIDSQAFEGCASLTGITIPDGVTTIETMTFSGCSSLTDITIPVSVTAIGERAFEDCTSLTGIIVPDCVTCIYSDAFSGCSNLTDLYYTGSREQWKSIDFGQYYPDTLPARITIHYNWHAGEHSFTDYIPNGDATCTADGTKTAKCDLCDVTDTQPDEGSALGHSWDEGIYSAPTQKVDGHTVYTCKACGAVDMIWDTVVPVSAITTQPAPVTADSGDTVSFKVKTNGYAVSYCWQYRKIYKWFDTTMTGYNTDTLTVPATGARNGYDYRCVITFDDGTVLISDPAELTVHTYLTLTGSPNDQVVVLGYKGQFTASAEGEGLKYQWQYQRPGGERWIDTTMEGANKPTVMIETTSARDGYKYRCVITDVTGNEVISESAIMTVLAFIRHPEEVFTRSNTAVTFSVNATAAEGFTYQWQYSKDGATWHDTTMTGYNTDTLAVSAPKPVMAISSVVS